MSDETEPALVTMSAMSTSFHASQRVRSFGETVFAKYTRLAQQHQAVNLGQGFPDFPPPAFVMDALAGAAVGNQQYAPLPGVGELTEALATKLSPALGQALEPVRNLQITVGATEALFAVMQAFVNPGDEVVLLEPFYDAYPADVLMAGGVPRYVPLRPQEDGSWLLDESELRAAFGARTKMIVVNTPHNPTGKVFSVAELDTIVSLAVEHDALIVSDEVYEHITFAPHVSIASRPGAWERTLTVSSVGKTFSVTGWKIGWAVGPEALVHPVRMAHQWIPFAVATPLQHATARILEHVRIEDGRYYRELADLYRHKRDLLVKAIRSTPLRPLEPQGSYFIMADTQALGFEDDVSLCEWLPEGIGVAAIPPSAFYSEAHKGLARHLVRLAFCKSDEALMEGGERLQALNSR
jgi:aspartate/methionine/tyrosine aminotransferase